MPKKENLSDSIKYQSGTIVSRTLVNKPSGTVTLFAFDKDQSLSEHTAPYDAMAYIIDGQAEIKIEEKLHKLSKGEMIIMPAGKAHALRARAKFKMALIMIKS